MTTDLRETLTEIRDAVPVPPLDHAGFDARVRHHRRRRRTARAVVGAVAVAAVAGVSVAAPAVIDRDQQPPISAPALETGVPVVLDGHVQEVAADGTVTDTGLTGTPVGTLRGRLVVLQGEQLVGVGDGPIDGVVAAYVDATGVTYQTTDGLIVFAGTRGQNSAQTPGTLLAGGGRVYVDLVGAGPRIHGAGGVHQVSLSSDGAVVRLDRVEVGDDTVAIVHDGGVEVYGANGERRSGFLGGTTGALSPDGATYAYAPSAAELAQGMSPGLVRYDTTTQRVRRVPLADPAIDLSWFDGALYVVTETAGERTLWQCDERACDPRLTDPDGTLALH